MWISTKRMRPMMPSYQFSSVNATASSFLTTFDQILSLDLLTSKCVRFPLYSTRAGFLEYRTGKLPKTPKSSDKLKYSIHGETDCRDVITYSLGHHLPNNPRKCWRRMPFRNAVVLSMGFDGPSEPIRSVKRSWCKMSSSRDQMMIQDVRPCIPSSTGSANSLVHREQKQLEGCLGRILCTEILYINAYIEFIWVSKSKTSRVGCRNVSSSELLTASWSCLGDLAMQSPSFQRSGTDKLRR